MPEAPPELAGGLLVGRTAGGLVEVPLGRRGHLRLRGVAVVTAREQTASGSRLSIRLVAEERIELLEARLEGHLPRWVERVIPGGFQSWTETRPLGATDRVRRLHPLVAPLMHHSTDAAIAAPDGALGRFHGFALLELLAADGRSAIVASLAEGSAHTVLRADLRRRTLTVTRDIAGRVLEPGERFELLSLLLTRPAAQATTRAAHAAARGAVESPAAPLLGYTSWYYHYTAVSEAAIRKAIGAASGSGVPFDVIQVDDGWQRDVGDWLETSASFPSGMKALAAEIRAAGFVPGLWLAPLVCTRRSRLYLERPELLLRDEAGAPVVAGVNPLWGGRFFAIDLAKPAAREYVRVALRTAVETWGYGLLKLDFLYAAGLRARPRMTRGEAVADALRLFREAAGDALLLGCGVPMGQALGAFDICRVSSDVAERWEIPALEWVGLRERLSTRNAIRSTLGRAQLDGLAFAADPDVFFLRSERCTLTDDEKMTLLLVNAVLGSALFTSDDVSAYDERARFRLRSLFPRAPATAREVVPLGEDRHRVRFQARGRRYELLVSLAARETTVSVHHEGLVCLGGGELVLGPTALRIPAHGARVFLLPDDGGEAAGKPVVLGSSRHLLPGADVADLSADGRGGVVLVLDPACRNEGVVHIGAPRGATGATLEVNGRPYRLVPRGGRLVATVRVRADGTLAEDGADGRTAG